MMRYLAIIVLLPASVAQANYFDTVLNDAPIIYMRLADSDCITPVEVAAGESASPINSCVNLDGEYNAASPAACQVPGLIFGDSNTAFATNKCTDTGYTVNMGTTPTPSSLTGDFTVEAWIKLAALPSSGTCLGIPEAVYGNQKPAAHTYFMFRFTDDTHVKLTIGDNVNSFGFCVNDDASFSPVVGTIYHVVATISSTGYNVYINNSSVMSGAVPCTPVAWDANHALSWASNGGGNNLDGVIDEVAVYPYLLSPTRIGDHYHCGHDGTFCDDGSTGTNTCFPLPPSPTGEVLDWPMTARRDNGSTCTPS